jgi:hypothetical protein
METSKVIQALEIVSEQDPDHWNSQKRRWNPPDSSFACFDGAEEGYEYVVEEIKSLITGISPNEMDSLSEKRVESIKRAENARRFERKVVGSFDVGEKPFEEELKAVVRGTEMKKTSACEALERVRREKEKEILKLIFTSVKDLHK